MGSCPASHVRVSKSLAYQIGTVHEHKNPDSRKSTAATCIHSIGNQSSLAPTLGQIHVRLASLRQEILRSLNLEFQIPFLFDIYIYAMGEGGYRQINKTLNACAFDDYLNVQQSRLPKLLNIQELSPRVIRILGQNPGKVSVAKSEYTDVCS